jgi:hypothetical protein
LENKTQKTLNSHHFEDNFAKNNLKLGWAKIGKYYFGP